MTSAIENETTNSVVFFKPNFLTERLIGIRFKSNLNGKFPALLPRSFLLSHWEKKKERKGRITNKARHLAFSHLKAVKISPPRCLWRE